MSHSKRIFWVFLIVALLAAMPATAFANVRIYRSSLTGAQVVPPVTVPTGGTAVLGTMPGGMYVSVTGRNLTGEVTAVTLHGPAAAGATGPVILTVCGDPAPAAVSVCPVRDGSGVFSVTGNITSPLLSAWSLPASQFRDWLDAGLVYVTLSTAAYPGGEKRGQLQLQ
jgi:hypothetical protein